MTRDEAIKILDNEKPCCGEKIAYTEGERYAAYDMAIAALREREGKDTNVPTKWISVEEKLPEKYTIVLCYKDKQWRLGYYIGASYRKGVAVFRHPKDQFAFGVTHWMPLPTPPEVEV